MLLWCVIEIVTWIISYKEKGFILPDVQEHVNEGIFAV